MRLNSLFQFAKTTVEKGSFWVSQNTVLTLNEGNGNRAIRIVAHSKAADDLSGVSSSIFQDMSYKIVPIGVSLNNTKKAYVISTWKVTKLPTEVTFNVTNETRFTDSSLIQGTADLARVSNIGFFSEEIDPRDKKRVTGSEWFPIQRDGVQNKVVRVLFIVYNLIRKHLNLDLKFIDVNSLSLDIVQYTDFSKFYFYSGINAKNVLSLNTRFVFDDILGSESEASSISSAVEMGIVERKISNGLEELVIKSESELDLIRILIGTLNTTSLLYKNSVEAISLFTVQKTLLPDKVSMSNIQMLQKIATWFDRIQVQDVRDLLLKKNVEKFNLKFRGFKWGTPGAISSSYFVNIVTLLDPTFAEMARSLTKTTFSSYWHGNSADFVQSILSNSNSFILRTFLPKAITFHSF